MDNVENVGLKELGLKLPVLTKEERIQVKISDLLEMCETGEHEFRMGNTYAEPIVKDSMHAVQAIAMESCMSQHVNEWITKQRNKV
jgi:hypothetical protein